LGLADGSPEREFDEIVELAATLCGKPLGAMSLLTETENYTKATVGIAPARIPIRESLCRFTVLHEDGMVVEDTHADHRFDEHAAVVHREGGIRFYAGMPLTTADGTRVGALCVMDTAPSTLSPEQTRSLQVLARQISIRLQLRERAVALTTMANDLEGSHAMFETILNNLPIEVYLKDGDGKLQFYNRKLAERFNVSMTDWLGKTSSDLWDAETADDIMMEDRYVLRTGRPHESFTELPDPAGGKSSFWRNMKVPCQIPHGEQLLACCSVDMTEQMERQRKLQEMQDQLEEANRKLNSLALTDALTGLWNRRAFDARLETNVIGAQISKQPMALMLLDVDNFKSINDRFGHPYGDVVLQHIASVLSRAKRAEDVACRFGGEEFAILMPGTTVQGAQRLGERIIEALHNFPWEREPVTASLGVAMGAQTSSSDELVDSAEGALYQAKRDGKDRIVCMECKVA
jgi:diguanylate cyclase (GGDEF)-like protein